MELQLTASLREEIGKGAARQLRRLGQIPAVLSRPGQDSIALSVDARVLGRALTRGALNRLVKLSVGKGKHTVLVREVQYDHISGQPIHVDFVEVALNEPVEVKVPISIEEDVRKTPDGGLIGQLLHELSISCLPAEIPKRIEMPTAGLTIGSQILVKDLPVPPGVKVLTDPDEIVVTVAQPAVSAAVAGNEGEETAPDKTEKNKEE
ncbi:MAG TPA: 50S ribosomal protein L25 [Firmicutes bacterium]|jgi:large subunit ribosomal protein L25|nr:50S ribosomal protein L25 [Bacillota bacterium]HOQ23469.1 50S ribosomal protein L25 [Bacillota bacterium]HPT67877.1 50S ribosomal protein L25 [Bacillota bacterium]